MSRTFKDEQKLSKALGGLPRSKTPGRDLWPDIAMRLHQQPVVAPNSVPAWRAPALAASVAVAFAAGILLGRQLSNEHPADAGLQRHANPALIAAAQANELEYQAAMKTLAPVGFAPAVFAMQDIQDMEGSWAALHQAETALLAALQAHPDNPFLAEKLMDLRGQQLEFIKQIHMLDQSSRRNT